MVASGMGLWFCLAMRLRVFMALAVRPDRMSKRGLSGSHCGTRRRLGPPLPLCWGHPSIADGPTLAEMRKIPTGVADSPSSHLQPRVGITSSANTISNVEPKPQNSWSTQRQHAGGGYRWNLLFFLKFPEWQQRHLTSSSAKQRPLWAVGRNSEYSVILQPLRQLLVL